MRGCIKYVLLFFLVVLYKYSLYSPRLVLTVGTQYRPTTNPCLKHGKPSTRSPLEALHLVLCLRVVDFAGKCKSLPYWEDNHPGGRVLRHYRWRESQDPRRRGYSTWSTTPYFRQQTTRGSSFTVWPQCPKRVDTQSRPSSHNHVGGWVLR